MKETGLTFHDHTGTDRHVAPPLMQRQDGGDVCLGATGLVKHPERRLIWIMQPAKAKLQSAT